MCWKPLLAKRFGLHKLIYTISKINSKPPHFMKRLGSIK